MTRLREDRFGGRAARRHPADRAGDWVRWALAAIVFAGLTVFGPALWAAWGRILEAVARGWG